MSDISKINVDGVDYDVKDAKARELLNEKVPFVLPSVTTADNGKILKVVNGVWTAVAE